MSKIVEKHSGFYVVLPEHSVPAVPLFCPVCDYAMRSRDDDAAHEKFGCCSACADDFAYPRTADWLSGWRPTREEIEKAVKLRPSLSLPVLAF